MEFLDRFYLTTLVLCCSSCPRDRAPFFSHPDKHSVKEAIQSSFSSPVSWYSQGATKLREKRWRHSLPVTHFLFICSLSLFVVSVSVTNSLTWSTLGETVFAGSVLAYSFRGQNPSQQGRPGCRSMMIELVKLCLLSGQEIESMGQGWELHPHAFHFLLLGTTHDWGPGVLLRRWAYACRW